MSGQVDYPASNQDACTAFTPGQFKVAPGEMPKIVLVDRGSCYFTTKAYHLQLGGASAALVMDNKDEELITMDAPDATITEDNKTISEQVITIPTVLIRMEDGNKIKEALRQKQLVSVVLDWTESITNPDQRVEYELWTNSNDKCGDKCEMIKNFVNEFRGVAQNLEKGKYTQFTPHFITWYCPKAYVDTHQCQSQCINFGRYCAPDPEQDFTVGYDGKDVVMENLRRLCIFKQLNDSGTPWKWWDYVYDFGKRCPMEGKDGQQLYNQGCSEDVMKSLGVDVAKVMDCVGDKDADKENEILKREQEAQVGNNERGDVTILPTLIINNAQYRGKLEKNAVLKGICAGFKESTEPTVCLGGDIETDECQTNNGGCWEGPDVNGQKITACKDTFRGRICECPKTGDVTFVGDGFKECNSSGPGRCKINNGGCWQADHEGRHFTACDDALGGTGCKCPAGFEGDGKTCEDIDECKTMCQCSGCQCKNTYGSFECTCASDQLYMQEHDTCIRKVGSSSTRTLWITMTILVSVLAFVGMAAYAVYKYRLRSYMDSEIRAIMAQYMPLDQGEPGHSSRMDSDL
eukprot:TRINITY_DN8984_c0_g1_i2.p1 TRINITY_DN8984_c0_g1~~TRINITY_DN8984_c0_g1_i2.p1  ORF type:complete len:657 (+),score=135.57 TRINITY_DN8984_c0_g1_i2:244-1971(+)